MASYYSDVASSPSLMYDTPGCSLKQPFFLTTTAALVNGDLLYLCPILPQSTVLGYLVDCPELDTNGAATAQASLGDSLAGGAARFSADSTYIRNACRFSSVVDDGASSDTVGCIFNVLPRVYTAPAYLLLTITAAVATSAAIGTVIRGWLEYTMQPKYRRPRR